MRVLVVELPFEGDQIIFKRGATILIVITIVIINNHLGQRHLGQQVGGFSNLPGLEIELLAPLKVEKTLKEAKKIYYIILYYIIL